MRTNQRVWAKEGSDLTLTCDAKGYPAPVLTWKKDNEVVVNNTDTLQLTGATFNQSGRYECWAENKHGVDAKAFYLSFTGTNLHYST